MTDVEVEHSAVASADPATVFDLIADVRLWPALFGPTVDVDVLETNVDEGRVASERFRISALVGGQVQQWTSRRRLDRASLVVDFEQEHARPPLSRMSGSWHLRPTHGGTAIVLTHRFTPADPSPESRRWILKVLDANSQRELGAIRRATRTGFRLEDLVVTCEDTVAVAPGADPYDFVDRADRWPALVPHVEHVELREPAAGVQDLSMGTRVGGNVHQTRSIRLCTRPTRIVYKQVELPAGLLGHSGAWEFDLTRDGSTATSRHTALLDPSTIATPEALDETRARVGRALSANSRATLSYAAEWRPCPTGHR